jgi:DeoR/GlpR family transcriptional regulator of sugar metabolism
MLKQSRVKKILENLTTIGKVSIKTLARELQTSEATIRRDLDYLAESYNEIERTFGGAIFNKNGSLSEVELLLDLKMDIEKQSKLKIAKAAKSFVEDGDIILIDSGSTCYYFAKELTTFQNLTVICTDLKIAEMLAYHSGITTFIIGGEVRHSLFSVGSYYAEEFIKNFSLNKVFMSCDAVDTSMGTISNSSTFEVGLKKQIFKNGEKIYLILDSTKFNKKSIYTIGNLSKASAIITDYKPRPEDEALERTQVVVV